MEDDRDGQQGASDESSEDEVESNSSDASSNGGALHINRGVYFSKNQYFFTNPKKGPARDSRDTFALDSDISARTLKRQFFCTW